MSLYPAARAYSAYDLGARGSVTEAEGTVLNPVQRWRRGSDDALQMFTAKDIADGAALDFANHGTTDLYGSARYLGTTGSFCDFASLIPLVGDFAVSFTLFDTGASFDVIQRNNANRITVTASKRIQVNIDSNNYAFTSLPALTVGVEVVITRVGTDLKVAYAGQDQTLTSVTTTLSLSRIGGNLTTRSVATITDININGVAAYTGLGTSVTAWEDTIGSNDGTETNGATFTGQGYDAYLLTEYDQSGNGYDLTQPTAAWQPLVVSGGALTLDSRGNRTVFQDTVLKSMSSSDSLSALGTGNMIVSLVSATSKGIIATETASSTYIGVFESGSTSTIINQNTGADPSWFKNSSAFTAATTRGDMYDNIGGGTSNIITATGVDFTNWTSGIIPLGYTNSAFTPIGNRTAFMIFPSDTDRAAIEAKLSTIVTTALS